MGDRAAGGCRRHDARGTNELRLLLPPGKLHDPGGRRGQRPAPQTDRTARAPRRQHLARRPPLVRTLTLAILVLVLSAATVQATAASAELSTPTLQATAANAE